MEILKCPYCNEACLYVSDGGYTSHDRDINAAKNILAEGLRKIA